MKRILIISLMILGLAGITGLAAAGKPSAQAQGLNERAAVGSCNAAISSNLGRLEQINHGVNVSRNCVEVAKTLGEMTEAGCGELFAEGKLAASKYRADGHVMTTICTAVVDACGLDLPPGTCSE
jgi:hypothetical protein